MLCEMLYQEIKKKHLILNTYFFWKLVLGNTG